MKPNRPFYLLPLVLTLLAAGCSKPSRTNTHTTPPPAAINLSNTTSPSTTTSPTPNTIPTTAQSTPPSATQAYESYSSAQAEAAHKAGKKVVLFFYADWCPFCVEADKQFKARLSELPANTVILKTNYDTETALKKKYAVTYQHTFVQIDAEGKLVSKWNGGDVENLKKYLK